MEREGMCRIECVNLLVLFTFFTLWEGDLEDLDVSHLACVLLLAVAAHKPHGPASHAVFLCRGVIGCERAIIA